MANQKFTVYYTLPREKGGRDLQAIVEAPDREAAQNIAENLYGNVRAIGSAPFEKSQPSRVRSDSSRAPERYSVPLSSHEDDEDSAVLSIGRSFARDQLGVLGESLSDRTISILMLLVLGTPVVGLWLGIPIYRASLLAPTMGFPPMTLCIGVGVVAFCFGWLLLYLCPTIILRVVGLIVYAGWVVFFISGGRLDLVSGRFDVDLLRNAFVNIVTTNTDATNLQKFGVLVAGLAGASVMGNLGKAVRGR